MINDAAGAKKLAVMAASRAAGEHLQKQGLRDRFTDMTREQWEDFVRVTCEAYHRGMHEAIHRPDYTPF